MRAMPSIVRISARIYGGLLRLYPHSYRKGDGQEQVFVFREMCTDAYERKGSIGVLSLWLGAPKDLLSSAFALRVESLKDREAEVARARAQKQVPTRLEYSPRAMIPMLIVGVFGFGLTFQSFKFFLYNISPELYELCLAVVVVSALDSLLITIRFCRSARTTVPEE